MLRIIVVLSLLGLFDYQTCLGEKTDNWRTQGLYRPEQNHHAFPVNHGRNSQSQNAFRSDFSQSSTTNRQREINSYGINHQNTQSLFKFSSQPEYSFESGYQNLKPSDTARTDFGQNYNQNVFGISNQNTQKPNSFGFASQNLFGTNYTQKAGSQNNLGSANQNAFGSFKSRNTEGTNSGQNSLGSSLSQLHNNRVKTSSQPLFGTVFGGQNTQTQNYLQRNFNAQKSQNAFGDTAQNTQTQNSFGLQSQNAFSAFGLHSEFAKGHSYQGPDYIPPKSFMAPEYLPPKNTTTTKQPFYNKTKYPNSVSPAMAMEAPPPEPEDDDLIPGTISTTPSTTITTTVAVTAALPAMAMPAPLPEPEDDDFIISTVISTTPSTTVSTTPSTTVSTTPSTTVSTTPSTTVSTTASTTVSTTLSTTLSTTPSTTVSTTPSTTVSTTPSTTVSTTPSTTVSTTPSTTVSTTPSTTVSTTPSTTVSTTPSTTVSTTPSTTVSTTPSTTLSTTPSTTTPDLNRYLTEEEFRPTTPPTVITTPSTTTSKSPLLSINNVYVHIHKYALPKCNLLDPSTYPSELDYRYFGDSPCTRITTTTVKPPYHGYFYLPPPPQEPLCVPKTRVRRSQEDTLRLGDLQGTPRPVWYAGIYKKDTAPYRAICGGSIIRENIVISAAHCFWNDVGGKQPADLFAVATSKIYKPWNDPMDKKAQKSSTTVSTTPSTTVSTTPSTTVSTTPSTTVSTTASTTVSTTLSTTLSTTPSTTVSTTPSTTVSTTPSTTVSTTPSTTVSTTPSTTVSTTPSTTVSTTPSTTVSTTPSTTVSTTPSTTVSTTPSTTLSTTPSTTTPDLNRYLTEEEFRPTTPPTVITTPSTTTSKSPLLSINNVYVHIHKYALPKCNLLDPSTYPSELDYRYFGDSPCTRITTTTVKPPYHGYFYLPPPPQEPLCVPKTRVRRSQEDTLRLGDLQGTPRPVWYAGIYKKDTAPYRAICGGSIIRENIVISAAHCFWNDVGGKQPADLFAVATSKIYKPWNDPMDKKAQKSDLLDIMIPPRYLGAKASFQEDIAILKLATPFKYTRNVRPICVDFDVDFDRQQLKAGHYGTIAGWGYTDSKGTPTQRLLWLELPYVEIEKCIRDSEESFLKYITSDKVCAGENDTGKALCRGDSGGGLAFWQGPASHGTPYLRGVASTAPTDRNAECNVFAYGSFTWLYAHRTFLRDHVPDIETCRFWEYQ